jgi:hypothetical protein
MALFFQKKTLRMSLSTLQIIGEPRLKINHCKSGRYQWFDSFKTSLNLSREPNFKVIRTTVTVMALPSV